MLGKGFKTMKVDEKNNYVSKIVIFFLLNKLI